MIKEFVEALKVRLIERKSSYVHVNEWAGDTETGFHDETEIDMEQLMAEIDEFAASFQKEAK